MRQAIVNGRWNLWLPDDIACWDAITGDYTAKQGWEFVRFESMQKCLSWGDTLYDVGAEHGWISAILAREFVGGGNMVLFEPSPEMWVNIRKTWEYNGLEDPVGFWPGFVAAKKSESATPEAYKAMVRDWPEWTEGDTAEVGAMPYRSLSDPGTIPAISLDLFSAMTGIFPHALNIDVEGAEVEVLSGARSIFTHPSSLLRHCWVSIHPDLMMENFGTDAGELLQMLDSWGWVGEHLGTDHEEHWHFQRRVA